MTEHAPTRGPHILSERLAVAAVVLLLVISGLVAFRQIQRLRTRTNRVEQSHKLLGNLQSIESMVRSAESGQRGYIITGQDSYLQPFAYAREVVDSLLSELAAQSLDDSNKSKNVARLASLIQTKMDELAATIEVRRNEGFDQVQKVVANNFSKRTMDEISSAIDDLRRSENSLMKQREETAATAYAGALAIALISTVAGLALVTAVLYLIQRNRHRAELAAEAIRAEHERLQASLDRNTLLELENRRMDQYMRTIVQQVHDYAIFGMDADCRATTWNEGVLQVLGFEETEFLGQDVRQLIFTPEAIELDIPGVEFQTAIQEGSASDDRWMMRKCGKRFWASGITSAVRDEQNRVIGFSKVMRDLTERKRDEDELAELAAKLSESNRYMNEFLATLAHELRNPLAPIKSAVELLSMSDLSPENEEIRLTIARQVEQVIRLIDDLLDVSRIGHGKIALQKRFVDLRTLIDSAVEATRTFVDEKGQNLQVFTGESEVLVDADPARIIQVISNLLTNASRYSDAGCHIKLSLTVAMQLGNCSMAELIVEDDGIGISADRLDEIFQMFAQIHDALGRGDVGLGIGLTLVKTLVELHSGTVNAYSDGIGRGSRFTVSLPLAPANATVKLDDPKTEKPVYVRKFRVLVVEDMRALRTIMARLLKRLGHEVQVAEDGLAALECLTHFVPDVVFSDISMPGMTGYDLVQKLREQPALCNTYLVAMTGYGQLSDRTQSRESGFDEHMVKPVDIAALRELFDRLSRSNGDR